MTTEWIADCVLNVIVKELAAQGMDVGDASGDLHATGKSAIEFTPAPAQRAEVPLELALARAHL